jgi:NNP family nitrate/nitrite transporter-like MFS transporter
LEERATFKSHKTLFFNAFAFTVCFAAWMLNGVLITFLSSNQVFDWGPVELGWLMGVPVLTGSIFRLPAGILTDKFGGKPVYGGLLLMSAIPMFLVSRADSFLDFLLCGFGFGLTGVSFAIGIAFTSVWYPKRLQGTALGIFGAGNAGAALTTLFAPTLLNKLTNDGAALEGWRTLPIIYAAMLAVMGIVFLIFTDNKKPRTHGRKLGRMLTPLRNVRVWRFGLYYFLVFGCFVAFSQWLVPYFVFPSGVIRALGGVMSDKMGARKVMYWVLGSSVLISFLLTVPKMEIYSPGKGVMAKSSGTVTKVTATEIVVDNRSYAIEKNGRSFDNLDDNVMVFPTRAGWQEAVVEEGQTVDKKQLLAKGVTEIYFQANVWIFAILVVLLGSIWGIGKAAVYKHIPDYFPEEVGVVGGMVGVLGGLGGFFCPIIFGYLLEFTGLWTSCWMFMFLISTICLIWMHIVIQRMIGKKEPELTKQFEENFTEPIAMNPGQQITAARQEN